jgi:hypothetical protein
MEELIFTGKVGDAVPRLYMYFHLSSLELSRKEIGRLMMAKGAVLNYSLHERCTVCGPLHARACFYGVKFKTPRDLLDAPGIFRT